MWLVAAAAHSGLGDLDEAERVCRKAIEWMREPMDVLYARSVLGVLLQRMSEIAVVAHTEVANEL